MTRVGPERPKRFAVRSTTRATCTGSTSALALHAREQEQVLDDPVEPLGLGMDVVERVRLALFIEQAAAVSQHLRVTKDDGNRRPQLVRDEAEEVVLRLVRLAQAVQPSQ